MKIFYLTTILNLTTIFLNAQNVSFDWANTFGAYYLADAGTSITTDASGNVYTTGYFYGTVDFDPGSGIYNLASSGGDIFISKISSSGNFIWAKSIGGSSFDLGNSITTDASGNVYTTGYFNNTVDFDPGSGIYNLASSGYNDIFISKISSSGNFIWAKSIGGSSFDLGNSITTDASGNVYTTGYFNGTVDFDPGFSSFVLTSSGSADIFIHKLSTCSNTNTVTINACNNYTWINGVNYDSSINNVSYTLTNSVGCDSIIILDLTINNPTNSTINETVCDSLKLNNEPTFLSSGIYSFILQNSNGCDSVVNMDLTVNNSTSSIDSITACNSFTWIDGNTYTSNNETSQYILTNSEGCDSTVNLNLIINNSSFFIDSISSCDSYTWIDSITYTQSTNLPSYVLQTSSGCDSTVNLNLTITNPGSIDFITACDSYTWIDGNTYTSSTNTPEHIVQTNSGCDSTVVLDLTIIYSSNGVDIQTACNSFTWIDGVTYTSSNNTAIHTLTNALGCDSVVNLNLSLNNTLFNVAFASIQQVFTQPPFFTSFTNLTPNLNNYDFNWNFGDGDVVNSNAQTINHLYDYNGLYSVTLTATNKNTGCVDSLFQNEYIYCNGGQNPPLSVGEYKAGDITIYPNPTYDEITIKINDYQGPIKAQIHDLNGKLVKEGKERNIDLISLESGIYTLLVNYGDKEMSLKVIKK